MIAAVLPHKKRRALEHSFGFVLLYITRSRTRTWSANNPPRGYGLMEGLSKCSSTEGGSPARRRRLGCHYLPTKYLAANLHLFAPQLNCWDSILVPVLWAVVLVPLAIGPTSGFSKARSSRTPGSPQPCQRRLLMTGYTAVIWDPYENATRVYIKSFDHSSYDAVSEPYAVHKPEPRKGTPCRLLVFPAG